jgi:hypothetical protein
LRKSEAVYIKVSFNHYSLVRLKPTMLRKDLAFFNSFLHRPPLSPAISASALVF